MRGFLFISIQIMNTTNVADLYDDIQTGPHSRFGPNLAEHMQEMRRTVGGMNGQLNWLVKLILTSKINDRELKYRLAQIQKIQEESHELSIDLLRQLDDICSMPEPFGSLLKQSRDQAIKLIQTREK